jgi:hypothetical protein
MEMGCETLEDAKARMRELQRKIDEQIEEIRNSL